ncbi:MAG: PqqD family protein [Treponema sp.]|jgi:hypothetical protein|nr:PqqD family protein [Treponema sp.]
MALVYCKNNAAIAREEDGEVLLFEHQEEGNAKISLLNKTAYAIWDLCDGKNSVDDIVSFFWKKFAAVDTEKVKTDIMGFIDRMAGRGWLVLCDAGKKVPYYHFVRSDGASQTCNAGLSPLTSDSPCEAGIGFGKSVDDD